MNRTSIEWVRTYNHDGTFEEGYTVNPIRFRPYGSDRTTTMCQKISPGCKNCYAASIVRRFWPKDANDPFPGYTAQGLTTGEFILDEKQLLSVLKRKKPTRIFWGDMTDLFQAGIPDAFLDKCFAVCALTPHITHMFLTKRPERMLAYLTRPALFQSIHEEIKRRMGYDNPKRPAVNPTDIPLPNVWLGVSVENQATADARIPLLLKTPAAVRFISAEPLLDTLDLSRWLEPTGVECMDVCPGRRYVKDGEIETFVSSGETIPLCPDCGLRATWAGYDDGIDWVICGGESGPGARPMHPNWARSLRDQCVAAGVPFFFKQWGEWKPISEMPEPEHDALYVSNKKAPEEWQQDEYDESHGRRCTVRAEYMNFSGERGLDRGFHSIDGHGGMTFFGVGKKAAGALLDGVEHKQFPEVRPCQ